MLMKDGGGGTESGQRGLGVFGISLKSRRQPDRRVVGQKDKKTLEGSESQKGLLTVKYVFTHRGTIGIPR